MSGPLRAPSELLRAPSEKAIEEMSNAEVDAVFAARPRSRLGPGLVPRPPTYGGVQILRGPDLAAPLPPLDYLVRELGLVAGGGAPHLVAGYGFSGKTLALQALALDLATGGRIWGAFDNPTPRRVIHVDFEQGERLTARRYQRLALAAGVDLAAMKDLHVLVMPRLTLGSDEHRQSWHELMTGGALIIIDSLKAATGNLDENDSRIRGALDMLGALSEKTGCRALVIHHARKVSQEDPGGRYAIRGSSAIYDACDGVYLFTAQKGEPVLIEHVKARSHGEPVENYSLVIEDVASETDPKAAVRVSARGGELVLQRRQEQEETKRRERTARDAQRVRDVLQATPGLGREELAARAQMPNQRLSGAIVALGDDVIVREERDGRTRRKCHYLRGNT